MSFLRTSFLSGVLTIAGLAGCGSTPINMGSEQAKTTATGSAGGATARRNGPLASA